MVEVEGRDLEIVDQFCYLGEMMTCELGAREAMKARIRRGGDGCCRNKERVG